jgi:hypothetical protein
LAEKDAPGEKVGGPREGDPANAVPEPAPFRGDDDAVPRFRTDLRVERGASPALYDVTDPASGRRFTLYEFELAIARMLDGRRKVAEVVASGARLGIPMDAEGLYKFVRQMWHYGFLAPPGAGDALAGHGVGEGGTWDAREPWDEATRTLFQTGQRLLRLGRNADAASYFEAVLDAQPGNPEAAEMLALIARGGSLAAGPIGADRPDGAPAAPSSPPRSRAPLAVAVLVAVIVGGGAAAYLVSRSTPLPAAPPSPPPVSTAPPSVAPPVPAPAPASPTAPAWRTAAVERRSHPALAEVVAPGEGELTWSKAPDAPVALGEKVGVVRVAVLGGRKDAALHRRVAELEKLAAKDPAYRDRLERARRDERRAAARRKTKALKLVAPAAGLLSRAPEPGGRAEAGERLARIVDPAAWQLAVTLGGPEPAADAACEVVGDVPDDRAACRIAGRSHAGDRTEVVAEVAAADAPWLARTATAWVRLAPAGTPLAAPPAVAPPAR